MGLALLQTIVQRLKLEPAYGFFETFWATNKPKNFKYTTKKSTGLSPRQKITGQTKQASQDKTQNQLIRVDT